MTLTGILPVRHTAVMFQGSLLAVLLPIFSNKSDLDPLTGVFGSDRERERVYVSAVLYVRYVLTVLYVLFVLTVLYVLFVLRVFCVFFKQGVR